MKHGNIANSFFFDIERCYTANFPCSIPLKSGGLYFLLNKMFIKCLINP